MKKISLSLFFSFVLSILISPVFANTIFVGDFGDTGWRTWSYKFTQNWSGTLGIGLSNQDDVFWDSLLLIDNLSIAGTPGGDFAGYSAYGGGVPGYDRWGNPYDITDNPLANRSGVFISTGEMAALGNYYVPTEGSSMLGLGSVGYEIVNGDTSNWGGTYGAYITLPISVSAGETVAFDWAFLAFDYLPYHDFAFVFGLDDQGNQVYFEKIAQIPEPGTITLLGLGLLGLLGYRRFKA